MSNTKSIPATQDGTFKGSDLAEQIADSKRISVIKLLGDTRATTHSIPRDSITVTDKYITIPLKGEGTAGLDDGTDTSCSFSAQHLSEATQLGKDFYRLASCGCEYVFFTKGLAEVS